MRRIFASFFLVASSISTLPASAQVDQAAIDAFRPDVLDDIEKLEQNLVDTCPAGVWFDDRCRGQRFWKNVVPQEEVFANVFGKTEKRPGEIGSVVLTTMRDDATVHEYHLNGSPRSTPSSKVGGMVATLNEASLPGGGPLFDYELLSRVKIVRGATDGYNSLYYEIAVPRENGDLTLYYSVFRRYGPSNSWTDTVCTTDEFLSDSGNSGLAGCVTTTALPQGGSKDRSQCTASEEVGAAAVSWAATGACGAGLGFITQVAAVESSATVFAAVSVETANPFVGGAAGAGTYAVVAGGGTVVTGGVCKVAGAFAEDVAGHATGCVTSGLPATSDEIADIYDWYALLDEAASEWLDAPGTCMVCNGTAVEDTGGGMSDGEVWVDAELVCDDWDWIEGETLEGELWCEG